MGSSHRRGWRALLSLFRIRLAEGLEYRLAALAGATTSIFWSLISITVYIVFYTYADNRAGGLGALTLAQAVSYTWLTEFLMGMQPMSIDGDILTKINNGDVGIELCRPLDLYAHWFFRASAGRLSNVFTRGLACLVAGALIPGAYGLSAPASLAGLCMFAVSAFCAFLLCGAYSMLVVALRLNIDWGEGPSYIIMLLGGILSGSYLPLQLWPQSLQRFLLYQPFAGYLDIPARLYVGSMPPLEGVRAIVIQLCWTAAIVALGRIVMARKLRGVVVQGG